MQGPQIALAVGLAYLLGRRRKLRTALALGAAVAVGRLSHDSGQLLGRGAKALGGSAELRTVADLRGPLVEAGKAAARAAVTNQIDALSERLQDRSEALRRARRKAPDEERPERAPEEENEAYEEGQYDDEPQEPEYDEQEESPPPRATRARSSGAPARRRGR